MNSIEELIQKYSVSRFACHMKRNYLLKEDTNKPLMEYVTKEFEQIYNEIIEDLKNLQNELRAVNRNEAAKEVCVNCDELKETHSICGDCLTKIINENKQTD